MCIRDSPYCGRISFPLIYHVHYSLRSLISIRALPADAAPASHSLVRFVSMTPPINLYGYATSPYVRKTGAFLYYKQLPFTLVPVNPSDPENTLGKFGGTQVPVLEIGDEWRRESSDHALWLDEKFPERPLCPAEHRDQILELDDWG